MKLYQLLLPILLASAILSACKSPEFEIATTIDPEIVLVNLEDGDRAFIGNLLLKIDSLGPEGVGIFADFRIRKDSIQDLILKQGFARIKNDALPYDMEGDNFDHRTHSYFLSEVKDTGLMAFDRSTTLIRNFVPLPIINGRVKESFAMKLAQYLRPKTKFPVRPDQQLAIQYKRPLEMFLKLDGSFLLSMNASDFDIPKPFIVLVGYLGPGEEHMFRTPLRFLKDDLEHEQPDTYGTVILANQIRTILDYKD